MYPYISSTNVSLIDALIPDNKVHGANMGPTWVLSAPDGPHVGPMNLVYRDITQSICHRISIWFVVPLLLLVFGASMGFSYQYCQQIKMSNMNVAIVLSRYSTNFASNVTETDSFWRSFLVTLSLAVNTKQKNDLLKDNISKTQHQNSNSLLSMDRQGNYSSI